MLETSLNADIRSGQIGSVCVLILAILLGSLPSAFAADAVACAVPPPQPADALKAIEAISTIDSPALTPTTRIVPAGTSADFAVQKEFDSTTTYRAVIKGSSAVLLYETKIIPRRIPTDHTLVKSGTVAPASTLITLQIRSSLGTWWSEGTVYIFGCKEQSGPVFLSSMTMPISDWFYSGTLVWGLLIVIYVLIAIAAKVVDKSERKMSSWRYLDPVVLPAGATGKGNLAKLQILFFSVIVVGLVAYIFSRTGILSELSGTILVLLGIAGVGSAAAKGTDVSRNRLDFDNWVWFVRRGWLPKGGLAEVNNARWRDIVSTNDEFDVYHFQNLIFSIVVGGALVFIGLRDLATFSIPETLLGILGLSQVVLSWRKIGCTTLLFGAQCRDYQTERP